MCSLWGRVGRAGGMAVCRHEQNEESAEIEEGGGRRRRFKHNKEKPNSAKNPHKTGRKPFGIKGGTKLWWK